MTNIPLTDLFTIVFVLVDEWCQTKGKHYLHSKLGAKPELTDSEVITLMLMQDFIPYPSETQYVGRNIERLLTKTVLGLATRVIANVTSHILRRLLLVDFGVNVQIFAISSPA